MVQQRLVEELVSEEKYAQLPDLAYEEKEWVITLVTVVLTGLRSQAKRTLDNIKKAEAAVEKAQNGE